MEWTPTLAPDSASPLHVRIRRSIREAVRRGELLPGQQLPAIRDLADALEVNRLTVLKAVQALSRSGLLTTVRGKGVFIHPGLRPGAAAEDDRTRAGPFFEGLAEGPEPAAGTRSDDLQAMIDSSLRPDTISFSAGFPPPEAVPVEQIRRRLGRLLRQPAGARHLGYLPTRGDPRLLAALERLLAERGLPPGPGDRILVTHGAQQAVALCLDALLGPGEALALESPGYLGVIAACRLKRIPMCPVPVDEGGLNPERLERVLARREARVVYTVPSFQNPTAVTQSRRRRAQLLALARAHDALVIEDDIYADLRFGGHPIPPMKSLPGGERVITVGSFSKSLAPGLRIGFLVASGEVADQIRRSKEADDISTCSLSQSLLADLLESGAYRRHLVRVRRLYRQRRDAMLQALREHLPAWVRITRPRGGLHLWVMPERPLDADRLLARCLRVGVSFAPGRLFFCDGRRSSSFRLNYASHTPEQIRVGIERLAACLREEVG